MEQSINFCVISREERVPEDKEQRSDKNTLYKHNHLKTGHFIYKLINID